MKVALIGTGMIPIPPPGYGAVEKHLWNLQLALERRGHQVELVHRVVGPRSRHEYPFALWARRQARALSYDVLHLHTPGVAAVFSTLGPRDFVYTTHSRHWATRERVGHWTGYVLERRAVARARQVIAVAPVPIQRPHHVIPNGVDPARYRPDPSLRTGRIAIAVGQVVPHKCLHLAARAVRDLDWKLLIVGPQPDPAYAEAVRRAGAGQVELRGSVSEDELVALLAQADVMLHPSVSELLPMAVIEAMSAGLPVVASDAVGSLVRPGENGFVIPAAASEDDRVAQMRKCLKRLQTEPELRQRMGTRSRERALHEFSWDTVAARVEAVYRQALEPT